MQNAKAPQSDIGFMIQILTFTTSFENLKKREDEREKRSDSANFHFTTVE